MIAAPLDLALGRAAVWAIGNYQLYISPYKGFVCAHRVRFGGESCSQFGRRVFAEEGWWRGLRKLIGRFHECRDAARALNEGRRLNLQARAFDEDFDPEPETRKEPGPPRDVFDEACESCLESARGVCCQGLGECCCMAVME